MKTTREKRRDVKTLIHSLGLVQAKHAPLVPDLLADIEELESRIERLEAACQALQRWSIDDKGGRYLEGLQWTQDIQDAVIQAREALEK